MRKAIGLHQGSAQANFKLLPLRRTHAQAHKLEPQVLVVGVDQLALEAHLVVAQHDGHLLELGQQGLQRGAPKAQVKLGRKRKALPLRGLELTQNAECCRQLLELQRAQPHKGGQLVFVGAEQLGHKGLGLALVHQANARVAVLQHGGKTKLTQRHAGLGVVFDAPDDGGNVGDAVDRHNLGRAKVHVVGLVCF